MLLPVLTTQYKTLHQWLHGGYMSTKEKSLATKFIAARPYT